MSAQDFLRLNAQLGLRQRTVELGEKDAAYHGTRYAALRPWEPFYGECDGGGTGYIPKAKRAPSVMTGMVKEKVDAVTTRIVGSDKWAKVIATQVNEKTGDVTEGTPELNIATRRFADLGFRSSTRLPLQDLLVKGSGVLGFSVVDGKPHLRYMPTEWADAVFNSQVGTERARAYAQWLLESVDGMEAHLAKDDEGPLLPAVEDADPLDVAFISHSWRKQEEVLVAGVERTVTTVYRRDYLPTVTVEYEPIRIVDGQDRIPKWTPKPLDPHRLGFIQYTWWRPEGTIPGEMDGPAFVDPHLMSLSKQHDYAASMRSSAYDYNAFPRLSMKDLRLEGETQQNAAGTTNRSIAGGDPGVMLRTKSSGTSGAGEVKLLETSGAAIQLGIGHGDKLRDDAGNATGVQPLDSESLGALSGTAVQRLQEPKKAKVTEYRAVLEEYVQKLWDKICRAMGWPLTTLKWTWPPVHTLTAEDVQLWAQAFALARSANLLSHRTAVIQFATQINLEDPEAEWEAIEESLPESPPPMEFGGDEDDEDDEDGDDEDDDDDEGDR